MWYLKLKCTGNKLAAVPETGRFFNSKCIGKESNGEDNPAGNGIGSFKIYHAVCTVLT